MRIVHVVLSLGMGGQERLVVRMAHALQARGHEAHIVSLTEGGALRPEAGAIPVHDVTRRPGFDPRLYLGLYRLFRELRPDVVHAHNPAPLVYGVPAARAARVPVVVHTKHGNFQYPPRMLQLARVAARGVGAFVAVSEETAVAAREKERPRRERILVIENGIPLDSFSPDPQARQAIRSELGIPSDAHVVGSVGRLVPEKDYPLLVRAMAPLLSSHTRLLIVGEGAERGAIERAITDAVAPDRRSFVTLTGVRRDVPRVLCAFDVFASSSRTEGLPLVLPEAMTSGLPIVATAVGGVPSILPAEAGVLVPHGDAAALTKEIRALLDDSPRRQALGASARAYALRRFAEARMIDQYLEVYARR